MSKRKIVLILFVFVLVLTGLRVAWLNIYQAPSSPQAREGVIDLQNWEFTDHQTITLDGEWEFYPNQFLAPDTLDSESFISKGSLVAVPGSWEKAISDGQTNQGFGTYRLQILLPETKKTLYGIRLQDVSTASRLYIDGTLIAESGVPAQDAHQSKGKLGPYSALFHPDSRQIEFILHVANFDLPAGGILKSIKLGTEQAISKESHSSRTLQIIVCVFLMSHSLYAFGLYFIDGRRQQKEVVFFGLLLVFATLSILLEDDRIILSWLPLDVEWSYRLTFLSFIGTLFFMLQFLKYAFQIQARSFQLLFILYGFLAFLVSIVPFPYITYAGYAVMFLNAISYLLMFVLLLQIIRRGNTDAIFILLSNTGNLYNVLWGIAINLGWVNIGYYPFDFIISIIAFTLFLFKRHIQIYNENQERANKLQQIDKMRDEFLANTSHELRNPLHGMVNIAQSILEDETDPLSEKNKNSLELLINVGRRMTFTLNDLLDLTRLKEKNILLFKSNVHVHTVASGVFDMLRFMTEGKNIELRLEIPYTFPYVLADENRLIQILFNLLHNSVKYTESGSITMYADHKNGFATFYIKDTGIGIDQETQQKIFYPYEQVNTSSASIEGGVGLGLSICKQLVELHGGILTVDSTPGEGSIFSFTLPLAEDAHDSRDSALETAATVHTIDLSPKVVADREEPSFSAEAPNTLSTKRAKILVVDDDPVNLKILSQMLSPKYEIVTTTSAKEALDKVNHSEWDLVISDVMMPLMSGYELTRTIREQYSISELPILLLTARSQPEDIYTGFRSGANDHVAKPMDALELKSRVQSLVDLKQSIHEQLRMEAAWLQAQIKPHFLFNTLNTIASLSDIDTTRMVELLDKFGNYLQRSFAQSNAQTVIPLHTELDLVRSYLFIEKERFGERLQIKWEVDQGLKIQIPPLSIQPIVENAVRHGVLKRMSGGTVCLQIKEHTHHTEISVIDNGVGMDQQKVAKILSNQRDPSMGIGIANTNKRLKKLYGKGLVIHSHLDHGTTVSFQVPKKKR